MRSLPFPRASASQAPAGATAPSGRTDFLTRQPYAHRGLHGRGVIENSRAAFAAAVAAGHGIECDVQASRDGEAFVFHDWGLERLTGETGFVADRDARALDRILLKGTAEPIPSLHAVLTEILGKVPVLIEVKARTRDVAPLCRAVARALDGYRGDVAVMSFNPAVGRWFAANLPAPVRGLVVTEEGRRGLRGDLLRAVTMWWARAEFVAYDVRDLPSRFAAAVRKLRLPVLTWTVRDAAAEQTAFAHADEIIYERRG